MDKVKIAKVLEEVGNDNIKVGDVLVYNEQSNMYEIDIKETFSGNGFRSTNTYRFGLGKDFVESNNSKFEVSEVDKTENINKDSKEDSIKVVPVYKYIYVPSYIHPFTYWF